MGSDGVEVAKQRNGPVRIGFRGVTKNLFGHVFCPPVRVGAHAGMRGFAQRHVIVSGIDSSGRRENNVVDMVVAHGFTQRNRGEEVVVVIFQRHRNRFTDCLQPGKMNDTSDVIFFKDRIECSTVTDVIFIENEILSRNLLDAFKGFFTGIDQVVDNNHPVSLVQKLNTGMAADKAGSTGNKNVHFFLLSV